MMVLPQFQVLPEALPYINLKGLWDDTLWVTHYFSQYILLVSRGDFYNDTWNISIAHISPLGRAPLNIFGLSMSRTDAKPSQQLINIKHLV